MVPPGRLNGNEPRVEYHDTVVVRVGTVVDWECGIPKETGAAARLESNGVDVERVRAARTERLLHLGLLGRVRARAGEPRSIVGEVASRECEGDAGLGVVCVEHVDLGLELGRRDVATGERIVGADDVEENLRKGSNGGRVIYSTISIRV